MDVPLESLVEYVEWVRVQCNSSFTFCIVDEDIASPTPDPETSQPSPLPPTEKPEPTAGSDPETITKPERSPKAVFVFVPKANVESVLVCEPQQQHTSSRAFQWNSSELIGAPLTLAPSVHMQSWEVILW